MRGIVQFTFHREHVAPRSVGCGSTDDDVIGMLDPASPALDGQTGRNAIQIGRRRYRSVLRECGGQLVA